MEDIRSSLKEIYRKSFYKEPYNYQIDTIESIIDKLKEGGKRFFIMAPTGTGKSVMTILLAKYLVKHSPKGVLILTFHRALEDQFKQMLSSKNNTERQYVIKDNCKDHNIFVSTIHKLLRVCRGDNDLDVKNFNDRFEYIIADEFHDYNVKLFREFLNKLDVKIVTFSSVLKVTNDYDGTIPLIETNEMLSFSKTEIAQSSQEELISVKEQFAYFRTSIERERKDKEEIKYQYEKLIDFHSKEKNEIIKEYESERNKLENQLRQYESVIVSLTNSFKQVSNEINELKKDINNGVERLSDEIRKVGESINTVIITLSMLQEDVLSKINNSGIEKEIVYHDFSEALMKKIIDTVESKKDARYNIEKDNLVAIFGKHNWNKLSFESKEYLITSRIVFNNLLAYEHQVDFSPACIPLTKALEKELFIHIFMNFKSFCKSQLIPVRDWPDGLTYFDNKKSAYDELNNNKFTLGSTPFIVGGKDDNHRPKRAKSSRSVFVRYCNEHLFRKDLKLDDVTLNNYINGFEKDVSVITNKYRNQAAHKDEIKLKDAEECYNYIVAITKVLVTFIDKIS